MNIKLKAWFILIILTSLYGCQSNLDDNIINKQSSYTQETKNIISLLSKKIHDLSVFQSEEYLVNDFTLNTSIQSKSGIEAPEIGQMPIPFLHPNGNSEEDIFLKNAFFNILEMQELLRDLLENYNKFTIHTNLNILTHPAQIDSSNDLIKLIKFRRIIREEITFVQKTINIYNKKINIHFPNITYSQKMSGYYSFDNSHLSCNQTEFSIEDVDNFSYSYHQKLVTKNMLKEKKAKLKLHRPEVGTRRGTVFIKAGKPNVIRGALGNDFGGYALGVVVGMTIEYAITGKIYYYKDAL
ncbi:hypothetical protein [Tenacibaculum sp. nBUS_03]|uniref:hypothetical protein n=1 Tax=Tenacibaculum sp. nBUS_03 TaxID=3395320 RepID=UPI003EBBCCA4